MTRIEVRVVGRLQGGSVAEVDAAAKHTLVRRIPDHSRPVICPGWLAFWVERERARQVAEDAACERPSLAVLGMVGEPAAA